jgi:hypothetical protein
LRVSGKLVATMPLCSPHNVVSFITLVISTRFLVLLLGPVPEEMCSQHEILDSNS